MAQSRCGEYTTRSEADKRKARVVYIRKLAKDAWEGYNGDTPSEKELWINGYIKGYNRAK